MCFVNWTLISGRSIQMSKIQMEEVIMRGLDGPLGTNTKWRDISLTIFTRKSSPLKI